MHRSRLLTSGLALSLVCSALFAADAPKPAAQDDSMMQHAKGSFEVKMQPQGEDKAAGSTLGRRVLDKRFSGELEADSKGEMLTVMTEVKNSMAYVAVERVTGKLNGRSGSFALVHYGTMARGAQQASIDIVPDSGSGELTGIKGRMDIQVADGKHSYDLVYSLPTSP